MRERILFITNLLPYPLDNGGKIKTFNTLKILRRKYDIHLLCFVDSEHEKKYAKVLKELGIHTYCETKKILLHNKPFKMAVEILKSILNGKPYVVSKYYSNIFNQKVSYYLNNNDYRFIYIDHLQQFQYIPKNILATCKNKIILEQHNVEFILAKRYYQRSRNIFKKAIVFLEYLKLHHYEDRACQSAGLVFAITDRDKETLKNLCGNSIRLETSPSYIETNSDFRYQVDKNNSNKHILFLGTMSWYPNEDGIIWFFNNVFLQIKALYPNIKLDIVGSNPGENVLNLSRDKSVTITGYVEDITPYIAHALFSVVPIRIGGGMRIKILQLLAFGIPLVTTSIGCEGIPVTSDKEVLIADSEDEFLFAVKRLLNDINLRKELSFNAIEFIRNNYSIGCASQKYERIFNT